MTMRIHSIQPASVQFAGKWSDRVKKGLAIGAITALPWTAGTLAPANVRAADNNKEPDRQQQTKENRNEEALKKIDAFLGNKHLMPKNIDEYSMLKNIKKCTPQQVAIDLINELLSDEKNPLSESKIPLLKEAKRVILTLNLFEKGEIQLSDRQIKTQVNQLFDIACKLVENNKEAYKQLKQIQKQLNGIHLTNRQAALWIIGIAAGVFLLTTGTAGAALKRNGMPPELIIPFMIELMLYNPITLPFFWAKEKVFKTQKTTG